MLCSVNLSNQLTGLTLHILLPLPKPVPRFFNATCCGLILVLNGLRREIIVRLVDIDGIVDHDCLCFLFIIFFSSLLPASYLDLHLEIDKRNDFNFPIVNFPFISSNIPAAPAYRVYNSQMIRYSRACGSYQDFLDRGLLLTR